MERVNRILRHEAFQSHVQENEAAEEDRIFCHHDMAHFLDVARIAMIFNYQESLGIPRDMIYGAALLHDIGRHEQYETGTPHEEASARIAPDILADCGYDPEEIQKIAEAIALHRISDTGRRQDLAGILYRADKASRACFSCKASGQCNWKEDRKNREIIW
ncbi:MAG: HD domain-containing protein [Acetatifactor sp.]|nr:HD domain-containing protein [Acetatifactor sp.]